MTFLVERLADLRRHLDHLRGLAPRVDRVVSAVQQLDPVERFAEIVRRMLRPAD